MNRDGWQPMETRPIGQRVLVVVDGAVVIATYWPKVLGAGPGWLDARGWKLCPNPTAWMPLPSPPG